MKNTGILNEGGNAIKSAKPIRGDYAMVAANDIIGKLKQKYPQNHFATLGSTGKKGNDSYSGDIDIAVDIPIEKAEEIKDYLSSDKTLQTRLQGKELETNFMKGLKILSVGYPWASLGIGENSYGIVQCDLMFVPNVQRAQYFYYSPDFTKKQSQFKGLVRNIFMIAIMKHIPVQGKENTKFPNGHTKDLWKYTIKPQDGIVVLHQSYEGKKGQELKSKHTIKEDTRVVLDDPTKFTKFFMGPKATEDDISSFEKMWEYFWTNKFPWTDQRENITKDFIEDLTNENTNNPDLVEKVIDYMKGSEKFSLSFAFKTGIV